MSNTDQAIKCIAKSVVSSVRQKQREDIGWDDFLDFGAPTTGDIIDIAIEAAVYCCYDSLGTWNNDYAFFMALVTAVEETTGRVLDESHLKDVCNILGKGIDHCGELKIWFEACFR